MFLEVVLRPHELLGLSDFEPGFATTLPFTLETERWALRSHAGLATEGEHKTCSLVAGSGRSVGAADPALG